MSEEVVGEKYRLVPEEYLVVFIDAYLQRYRPHMSKRELMHMRAETVAPFQKVLLRRADPPPPSISSNDGADGATGSGESQHTK